MNVDEYRQYVYDFLQVDADELPSTMIDRWLREGFTRIVSVTKRLPHYETVETVTLASGDQSLVLASIAPDRVEAVKGPEIMLTWMSLPEATRKFHERSGVPAVSSYPVAWSRFGNTLQVWPIPNQGYTLEVVGWRDPSYTWLATAGGIPDIPEELHEPLLAWVMHRAFSWDDDPERSAQELGNFQSGVDHVLGEMLTEVPTGPLVMHGGRPRLPHFPAEPHWNI